MTTGAIALVVLGGLLVAAVAVLLARAHRDPGAALLQQQLIELGSRLDALLVAQRDLPQVLVEGSATQARSLADVRDQLVRLAEATRRLELVGQSVSEVRELLRVPRLRGTLGEVWLEELLRQVFPAALYQTQYAFRSGETVDAVVRVGGRLVPIDSKFPLEACQRMLAADGDEQGRERRAFRRVLKQRIDEIADKYIRPDEGTYDFALMYVPAEAVYYEGVVRSDQRDGGTSVAAYALEQRVILVSPNTFYAYLAAILHGLRGLEVEERAREILDSLAGLRQQFARFQRAYELVGRHLDNALKQYDSSERQLGGIRDRFGRIGGVEPLEVAPAEPAAPDEP